MDLNRHDRASANHMKTYTFCNASPLRSTSNGTSTALNVIAKSYENQHFFQCGPFETHLKADLNDFQCHLKADLNDFQCHTKTSTLATVG